MKILERPELADRLAAAYALGTLRGGARRRFEALARRSPGLRVAAQLWQERFMSMTELQQSEAPSPQVWKRIENLVAAEARPVRQQAAPRPRNWWRAGALAATAVAVVAVATAVLQLQAPAPVRYVAVLVDDKAVPMVLATFDPGRGMLMVKRVADFRQAPDKSLQLWAMQPAGTPRSLGVLPEQPVLRMPAPQHMMGQAPMLAISLEPKGGVSGENGPSGPVLWKGLVLQAPV